MKKKSEFTKISVSSYFLGRRLKSVTQALIVLGILFLAYLFGLIEVDSRKVVLKFMPTPLSGNSYNLDRSGYNFPTGNIQRSSDSSSSEQDKYDLKRRIDLADFIDIQKQPVQATVFKEIQIQPERTPIEKNIKNFFATIERSVIQITSMLKPFEANKMAELKEINLQRTKANKRSKKVTREILVNLIRYEHFKQKNSTTISVVNIKDLLEKMVSSEEISHIK